MKLTVKQITIAVQIYAKKNEMYVRTVRDVSNHRYAAIREYKEKIGM